MATVNVQNNSRRLVTCSRKDRELKKIVTVSLRPGDNEVDKDDWEFLTGSDGVKELLDADTGCLVVGKGKAKPLPTKASDDEKSAAKGRRADELKGFDVAQVKNIVADTDDEALLNAWLEDERKEVRGVVRKRLRELKKANG